MVSNFLRGICNCVRGIFCSEQGPAKDSWELAPLTPEYLEKEHGGYVAIAHAARESCRRFWAPILSSNAPWIGSLHIGPAQKR